MMLSGTQTWLRETITRYPFSAYDSEGMPTWGAGVSVPCKVDESPTKIMDVSGQESVSSAQIYVNGAQEFGLFDKILMTDGTIPRILRINHVDGPDGLLYMKVIYT